MANVLYGLNNTHSISIENIIQHTISVKKGVKNSLLVVDMPKGTYSNSKLAKKNAKYIMRLTKCDAVKIESNGRNFNIIKELVKIKIPVMGHIGFIHNLKITLKLKVIVKKSDKTFKRAKNVEKSGAFSIVLECISH